jgi:hypothetical protein
LIVLQLEPVDSLIRRESDRERGGELRALAALLFQDGAHAVIVLPQMSLPLSMQVVATVGKTLPATRLRLIRSVSDLGGIPRKGTDLIIMAEVDHVFHIRIFDGSGKMVVDTKVSRLKEAGRPVEDLLQQLGKFLPAPSSDAPEPIGRKKAQTIELTGSQEAQLMEACTSSVGYVAEPPGLERLLDAVSAVREVIASGELDASAFSGQTDPMPPGAVAGQDAQREIALDVCLFARSPAPRPE